MKSKYAIVILLAILAGCWDASVLSWFSSLFSAMNLVLTYSVLLALFSSGYGKSLTAAFVGGMTADAFLASSGWMPIRMVIAVLVVHTLSRYVFTNRSIWGICFLGSVAVLVDRLCLLIVDRIPLVTGGMRTLEAHAPVWMEIAWMCLLCSGVFVLIAAFSRRFHPTLSRVERMNNIPWGG